MIRVSCVAFRSEDELLLSLVVVVVVALVVVLVLLSSLPSLEVVPALRTRPSQDNL